MLEQNLNQTISAKFWGFMFYLWDFKKVDKILEFSKQNDIKEENE